MKALIRLFLTVAVPILLTLTSIRVIMTPYFLQFEYQRAGFPEDRYGLTTQDRILYGHYAVDYLLNGEPIDYLGNLIFPDSTAQYTLGELRHMEDVKVVTTYAYLIAVVVGILVIVSALFLRNQSAHFWIGLRDGGLLTLGLILVIVVGAVFLWDEFFVLFHSAFFADGTWYFPYDSTLIRLFPEQFWFDAALIIGGMTTAMALILLAISRTQLRSS